MITKRPMISCTFTIRKQTLGENKPGLPSGRRRGAAASVYDGSWYIYIVGGNYGGHATAVNWFDQYEVSTGKWAILSNFVNARDHVNAGIVDSGRLVCIAGGRDSGQTKPYRQTVAKTECYSFATGAWSLKADIPTPRGSSAYGMSCNGKLIVAGGEGHGIFDGQSWTTQLPKMRQPRTSTGLAVDCDCGGEAIYTANGSMKQGKAFDAKPMERIVLKQQGSC
jgi:hypothetical protein